MELTFEKFRFLCAAGGAELLHQRCAADLSVCVLCVCVAALHYSTSAVPLIFRFEARGRSRGVEIGFLSLYPKEKEFLYSSLTGLILLNLSQKEEHQLLEMHEKQSRQGNGNTPQTSTRQAVLQEELQKIQDEIAQLDAAQSAAEGVRF